MESIFYLGLAVSAMSVTLTRAGITADLRVWLGKKFPSLQGKLSCPYCMSHWIAVLLVAVYNPIVVEKVLLLDLLVSAFAVIGVAAVVSGVVITTISSLFPKGGNDA